MIFLCAVSPNDAKSINVVSGKLKSTLKNLKDYRVWLDVYAPDDIEIQDLISIYGFDKELFKSHRSYNKILRYNGYIFFELSSYFLDEDDVLNYDKNPMMYRAKAKFFIGDNFIVSFHSNSFPIHTQIFSILTDKKTYDTFISDAMTIIMDSILDDYYDVISNIREAVAVIEDRIVDDYIEGAIPVIRYNKKKWIILDDLIEDQMNMFRPVRLAVMSWSNDTIKETMMGFYDDLYTISNTMTRVKDNITEVWNMYSTLSQNEMNNSLFRLTVAAVIAVPINFIFAFWGMSLKVPLQDKGWGAYFVIFIIFIYTLITSGVFYYKSKKIKSGNLSTTHG